VHVDESEENLARSPMARLHVWGNIRATCDKIIASWTRPAAAPARGAIGPAVALEAADRFHSDAVPLKPQRLMKELSSRFPPSTRFLADSGNSMTWSTHYLQPRDRRPGTSSWLRMALDFAPMGWAIGAAVGMARANPRGPVVCITGDGAYLMSGQEITTAAQEELPVIFVVLNDHAYGMVMHGQRLAGAEPIAYELARVDYRRMAESMGVAGHVIESPGDLDALDFGLISTRRGPTLLDVRIDREEVPPMGLRIRTLGSGRT
jgi:acetolactate synthase-1/2/3 large subunit